MASTQATKQAARGAAQLLPQSVSGAGVRGHKARASLIYEMHAQLYPHLYDHDRQPVDMKEQTGAVKRFLPKKLKRGPMFWEGKREFKREYKDQRLEMAIKHTKNLQIYPSKPTIHKTCPDPVSLVSDAQMKRLDPTGARTRLFAKTNPECARVGDILLVRQRTGEPFAGVCINIRRRGVDTAILLRGQLTRVGVEMWFKVYSPLVEGIEVVQRAAKRARRARLTYMRKPKHDRGSVENVVRVYMRQKAALGTADGKKKGAAMAGMGKKGGNKRGNKRR